MLFISAYLLRLFVYNVQGVMCYNLEECAVNAVTNVVLNMGNEFRS